MSDLWPNKWSRSLTREFLKQYLTEKQNSYLESGRLREVVAMRELTVVRDLILVSTLNYGNEVLYSTASDPQNGPQMILDRK